MTPVGKALWFIESHFAGDISLDEIAGISGVSRYHLSRAFGEAMGQPIMRYVRSRRLTEAAKSLADGATDILAVALDAGYASHEAFTRAFREQFGLTPEAVRGRRRFDNLSLVEPIKMDETLLTAIEPPRFADGKPLLIAGLGQRYTCDTSTAIPSQWQRFGPHIGHVAGQKPGRAAYGVRCNSDDDGNFDYITGVEVTNFSDLPADFARVRLSRRRYAVFTHRDHVSTIRRTINTAWNAWLPASGHEVADAPDFEFYGEDFDPLTGNGTIEIWIPLKA
ncbi:MAG TPA: AraC family transcriptional regulator [Candidatus Cybelea sp.]|nr:AraC family transcriptional regulator [Candidatus Cybelea sp.]